MTGGRARRMIVFRAVGPDTLFRYPGLTCDGILGERAGSAAGSRLQVVEIWGMSRITRP